jgi:hypothetical protein
MQLDISFTGKDIEMRKFVPLVILTVSDFAFGVQTELLFNK